MSPTESPEPGAGPRPAGWVRALWPVLLAVLVLAVYAPSARNGFVYDDGELIVGPAAPDSPVEALRVFGERHWKGLPYYRPVARATMVLQKYLHGNDPLPFHLFNCALMALTAVAAYALLRRRVFGLTPGAAFLGAALFTLHPVASTTVYPIASGRETLIPALLAIVAVWAHLGAGLGARVLAWTFFALALFSKEQAIVVPLVFVLADALKLSANPPGRSVATWVGRYVPIVIVIAVYLAVRVALFGGTGEHRVVLFEDPPGPLRSLLFALQSVIDPSPPLVYEPRFERWFSWGHFAAVAVVTIALALWAARRWPEVGRRAAFWVGWFLLAIAPTANVFHQEAPFAERYAFLGSLGLIALALVLAAPSWSAPGFRRMAVAAGAVLVAACAWVSVGRAATYRDELTFLEQWVRSDPGSAKAHHGLGQFYVGVGEYDRALEQFDSAVRLQPNYAAAHNNLGTLLAMNGDPETARLHFRQALQFDPKHVPAYNNLAAALEAKGELDEAEALFLKSLALEPSDPSVHSALGGLYLKRNELDKALGQLDEAVRLDPNRAQDQYKLGQLWQARGDRRRAEFHFDRAVLVDPQFAAAHNNLGMLLGQRNEMALAKLHFEKALEINPDYVEAHLNYGNVLLYEGDLEGGRMQIEEALRLAPDSKAAQERMQALQKAIEAQGKQP